ncbi:MAG: hypothetical protein WCI05_15600 [Myxococcales bacterium]
MFGADGDLFLRDGVCRECVRLLRQWVFGVSELCAFVVQWGELAALREVWDADADVYFGKLVKLEHVFGRGGVYSDEYAVVRERGHADVRERLHVGSLRGSELLGDGANAGVWEMRQPNRNMRWDHGAVERVGCVPKRRRMLADRDASMR